MAEEKVFSVQPRFKFGDYPTGWALVDGIFRTGDSIPPYGTEFRDGYLSQAWVNEPMMAGVFSTWIEKAQTVEWKITGGKIQANHYAKLLHDADNGKGWTWHEGVQALDYLTTDKGSMEELGRESLDEGVVKRLTQYNPESQTTNFAELHAMLPAVTSGRVAGLQHLDSTRLIKVGLPGMRWRYFPEYAEPIFIPDDNMIQIQSMPSSQDRFSGYGHCALSRILDAKQLMLGYLTYYRQEIGDLPPEMMAIINGMSETAFMTALNKYKQDKKARNLDEYGKIFWLGSDDPMTPVDVKTISLTTPNKSFNYQTMIEWWAKLLALNTGEAVGEYWLIQHSGATKAVESIQSLKARGKGVAKYLQEKERKYNMKIMPMGVRFEYDNKDDEQDKQREDILAAKIGNLKNIASIGVDRQEPLFTIEEVKELAKHWEILPAEMTDEEMPTVMGAMLKDLYSQEERVTVHQNGRVELVKPVLKSDRDKEAAKFVYKSLEHTYLNGYMKHKDFKLEPELL